MPAEPPRDPWLLTVETSDGQSRTQPLADGEYDLGRGLDNALSIADQGISRRHARLRVSGPDVSIEDLDSKNGVLVNGRRIEKPTALRDGDQVVIGMAFLALRRPDSVRQWIDHGAARPETLVRPVEPDADRALETAAFEQSELVRATDDVKRLWLLYHSGRAAGGREPLPTRLRLVLERIRMAFDYERALVLLGSEAGRLEPAAVRAAGPTTTAVDGRLVAKALDERSALLTSVVERSAGAAQAIRPVLCVPLVAKDSALGLLYVEGAPGRAAYTGRDLDLATAIASQLALAVENDRLIAELKAGRDRLAEENQSLKDQVRAQHPLEGLVARGPAMDAVRTQVLKILHRDSTVLVLGESGTGKEVLARTIHYNGPRAERPFVALNCAALPESLIESELFGIEAGVATGVQKRLGRFEQAADGTLFLDEIGELPLPIQAKLLRVLEERTFERVGGQRSLRVEARIITATNRDLLAEVQQRRFREDLYYRLAIIPIALPPLRKRKEDIPALVEHFLRRHGNETLRVTPATMEALCAYDWPGNVRELSNEVERAVAMAEGSRIEPSDLSERLFPAKTAARAAPRPEAAAAGAAALAAVPQAPIGDLKTIVSHEVERIERAVIEQALAATGQNKLRAAKLLGLSREGLRKKMLRYSMSGDAED
jgi:Nif-specific regulatory protein